MVTIQAEKYKVQVQTEYFLCIVMYIHPSELDNQECKTKYIDQFSHNDLINVKSICLASKLLHSRNTFPPFSSACFGLKTILYPYANTRCLYYYDHLHQ